MKRREVIIRSDADGKIGYGHFIRSLALASYLGEDFECTFCTFNPTNKYPTDYQIREMSKVCPYRHIQAETMEDFNRKFVDGLEGNEIVVLDNYYFGTDYQRQIRAKGCRLVCVDDVHDRHMVADLILTGSPLEASSFSMEPYTKFCGGLSHHFLRPEFLRAAKSRRRLFREGNASRIVLAMGGADPFGLTKKILGILRDIDKELEISVIAGDTVAIDDIIGPKVKVFRRITASEITELFALADLGIFPSSTICVEALACRLPVAAGWFVDNQKDFYQYGVKEQLFLPLGNLLDDEKRLKEAITTALHTNNLLSPNIDFETGKAELIQLFKDL